MAPGKGKHRHCWVKWCEGMLLASHAADASTWAHLQTGITDGQLFITICHLEECASGLSCLLNFWWRHALRLRNFPNTVSSQHHPSSVKVQAAIVSGCITLFLARRYFFFFLGGNTATIIYKPLENKIHIVSSPSLVMRKKLKEHLGPVSYFKLIPRVSFAKWVQLTSSLLADKFVLTHIFYVRQRCVGSCRLGRESEWGW